MNWKSVEKDEINETSFQAEDNEIKYQLKSSKYSLKSIHQAKYHNSVHLPYLISSCPRKFNISVKNTTILFTLHQLPIQYSNSLVLM